MATVSRSSKISCSPWPWNFFFQADAGIQGGHVTGVQTCALPISRDDRGPAVAALDLTGREKLLKGGDSGAAIVSGDAGKSLLLEMVTGADARMPKQGTKLTARSEERRLGREATTAGGAVHCREAT